MALSAQLSGVNQSSGRGSVALVTRTVVSLIQGASVQEILIPLAWPIPALFPELPSLRASTDCLSAVTAAPVDLGVIADIPRIAAGSRRI